MTDNFCILVTGLSGSGKSTLAGKIAKEFDGTHYNADEIRAKHNDWDFSAEGRSRQMLRMYQLKNATQGLVILDFICPRETSRLFIAPDLTIFMDTVPESKYADTDSIYEKPERPDIHVKSWGEDVIRTLRKRLESFDDVIEPAKRNLFAEIAEGFVALASEPEIKEEASLPTEISRT